MEQAKESIKRQKKKVFRNFIALMAGSLTLLISIAIKFNFSYAKIIVNCAIITVLCNHYLHMKIYYGLSTLFQTNFFRLFFRYCTGV